MIHHDHAGAQGHGFNLIVGDIDKGGLQLSVEPGDFFAHLYPEFGIQVG